MSVEFVTITPDAEKTMAYLARVSNQKNQDNPEYSRLLSYCIKHHHWSVFEHAYMTLEISTSRMISSQILRHRTFTFQEFSQRYAEVTGDFPTPHLRRQDNKNRQNSIDDLPIALTMEMGAKIGSLFEHSKQLYESMLAAGVAKECARSVLTLASPTKIYMTGNIRSWIHYIELRSSNGTQKEHMDIALECKDIFKKHLPIVSRALDWTSTVSEDSVQVVS